MNLFLDSSAVIKLYVQEPGSDLVEQAVQGASIVAVSTLALPESTHAFARCARENILTEDQERTAYLALLEDWINFERFDADDWVAKDATIYTRSKALRGADAVQLATVAWLARERRNVRFLSFDDALNAAAKGVVKLYRE